MPFASSRQRRFMHAQHPDIADRWEDEALRKGEPAVQPNRERAAIERAYESAKAGRRKTRISAGEALRQRAGQKRGR